MKIIQNVILTAGTALNRASSLPSSILHPPASVSFANIGEGSYEDGKKTYLADADTSARYLLYKIDSDVDHVAIAGAGDDPVGPSDDQAAAGTAISINVLGARKGTVRVITDGTIANGDYVKAAASGQVTKASTTDLSFGRANLGTDTTRGAGDVITIIPVMPAKYVF